MTDVVAITTSGHCRAKNVLVAEVFLTSRSWEVKGAAELDRALTPRLDAQYRPPVPFRN